MSGDASERFRSEAQRYCAFVETSECDIADVLRMLLRLVALGLDLPSVEPTSDTAPDDPPGLDDDVRLVASRLSAQLGE